jgi:hydrogenase expression/formation protein HypC
MDAEGKYKSMCLAIPGKIIEIKKNQQATADFNGIEKEINISLVEVKKGDYVIVHAGFAIEKIGKADAESIKSLIK